MKNLLKHQLLKIFKSSVERVLPRNVLTERVKVVKNKLIIDEQAFTVNKNVYVVGFGKGVYGMMKTVEDLVNDHISSKIEVLEGAKNNLPDKEAEHNTTEIIKLVSSIDYKDLLIVLTTGGGSALLPSPIPPLTIEEKSEVIKLISASGANIEEINSVRKQLSQVKGGKLALMASPAKVINFILSDVINDPLDIIASGPTVPNTDDPKIGLNILAKYDLMRKTSNVVLKILNSSLNKDETRNFDHVHNFLIGNNSLAVDTAMDQARHFGYEPFVLTKSLQGEARLVGENISKMLNGINQYVRGTNQSPHKLKIILEDMNISDKSIHNFLNFVESLTDNPRNICLLFGGETVVKVKGTGTDGIDGLADSAGAIADADLIEDANKQGIHNVTEYLNNNDSNTFFSLLKNGDNLVKTGPHWNKRDGLAHCFRSVK
ncbi:Glycerate kinase [Nymphon striatum]|nr:Glycerate kinase [Nymphon striatum]